MNSGKRPSWLFAVSGGPDSMVALHMHLANAGAVCHVNYHARPSSDRDEAIVRAFCQERSLPLFVLSAHFHPGEGNFQNWARQTRYAFFATTARQQGCVVIATGHTRDDFLETAVMQKERGGNRLHYGIAAQAEYAGVPVFRPIINLTRTQVLAYAEQNFVPYGIDETNATPAYARNRTRLRLAQLDAEKSDALLASFVAWNEQHAAQRAAVDLALASWRNTGLAARHFCDLVPAALKEHVLYALLAEEGVTGMSAGKLSLLADFVCRGRGNTALRLGSGKGVTKRSGLLVFTNQGE